MRHIRPRSGARARHAYAYASRAQNMRQPTCVRLRREGGRRGRSRAVHLGPAAPVCLCPGWLERRSDMGSKSVGRSVGWADAGRDERERKRGKEERERFHQSITHIWVRFNAFTKRIAGSSGLLSLCVRVIRILSTLHVCRDMSKETKARFRELAQFPVRVRVMSYFRRRSREHWENMLNPLNRFADAGRARRQAGKPKTCREVYGIPGPTAHRHTPR